MSIRLYRLVFFLALALPACVSAQDFSGYNWYFGQGNTGLRFSRSDNSPSVITNKGALNIGGSAVVSYPTNGNLFFYTNGVSIFDASHLPMPGPALTGGSTTRNQAVAVCQNPAASNQYFIFANNGAITVSVVDSALIGNAGAFGQPPLGAVVSTGGTIAGMPAGLSEAMIMLPDPNGDDFWLITHRQGTSEYHFTKITTAGPTYTGSVTIGSILRAANFAYHPATRRLAVSPQEADRDIELLTITFPTGPGLPTLNGITVINTAINIATTQAIYDAEFSNNGLFLYVSVFGEGAASGDVLQYDLTDLVPPTPTAISVLSALPTESYGLQMGPDSVIYHLYQSGGSFFLGALTNTDTVGTLVNYNPNVFPGSFGGRQFPSFAPADSLDMKVFFEANGLCANAPTAFFPTVSPGADSLQWNFGDNTSSSDWSPVHTYQSGGNFQVRLTAFLNGQSKDTVQTITVTNFDVQISLVQDTTACSCELLTSKITNPPAPPPSNPCNRFTLTPQISGSGSLTWQWFGPGGLFSSGTGTSAPLQPDSAGYYYLVVSAGGSCSTYAGVNIKEYDVVDQRANFWYFGQNAGIDFNPVFDTPPGSPLSVSNPVMNAPEGTSIICDRNGQVLIFTDGNTLWRRDFSVVATGLGGDAASTQSSLIVPVPGDETLFYIFTTQRIYGSEYRLSYSLFDLKLNNGIGGMRETNVTLFQPSTERITSNGVWLIAHEYGNNSFRAYQVSPNGISNPVISSIGSDHANTSASSGEGYMEIGAQNRLAVALSTPSSNTLEIFDFVDSTGTVTNFRSVNLNSTAGQVYGLEFAAGGNKLFATLSGSPTSRLYEFAFDTLGMPFEIQPAQSATPITEQLGAIQMGPDNQIYVAVNNKPYLGVISVNGDTTQLSTFVSNQFPLQPAVPSAATSSTLGLPNFIQIISDQPQTPSLSVTGFCLGAPTNFSGAGSDNIDTLTWSFGDGAGASGAGLTQVEHTYAAAGDYTVILSITNRCVGLDTVMTRVIRINNLPPVPAPSVGVICDPAVPVALDANPTNFPNLAHNWTTTGETTRIINTTLPGVYEVINTDTQTTCSDTTTFTLFLPVTPIDLGADQEICSGTANITLNTFININNHVWSVSNNGTAGPYAVIGGNTGPTQLTDFTTMSGDPTVRSYAVQWQDIGGSNCFARDTITFTINQSPVASLTNGGNIACGGSNGTATVGITQPLTGAEMTYILSGPTGFTPRTRTNVDVGPPIPAETGLIAGTYIVQVTDQVSGCIGTASTIINTAAFVVDVPAPICNPSQITMTTTPAQIAPGTTYRLFNGNTNVLLEQGIFSSPQLTANQYAPGNYIIEVSNTSNCTNSRAVVVALAPSLPTGTINLGTICTNSQVTAVSAGATTFDWSLSDAGSVTPNNTATVTVNPGSHNLIVTIDDGAGGLCPTTATQTVTVDNFDPDFTFDPCTNSVILVATATNASSPLTNYIYNWTGPVTGTGQQLSINATPGSYTLSMQSTATGCPARTETKTVNIAGPLNVSLAVVGKPCDGGVGFGLTATPSRNVFVNGYVWSREGNVLGGQTTSQLTNLTAGGLYIVTATDGVCEASAGLDIFLFPSTPGELPSKVRICPEEANPNPDTQEAELDPGDGFLSYDWFEQIGGSQSPLGVTTQTYTTQDPGLYGVTLENSFNCFSIDYSEVEIECEPIITGPNAFRPTSPVVEGGQPVNQQFRLITFFLDEDDFQIYIYSRWGELVYQSNQLTFGWNGGYNNNLSQMMPSGTYTWVVRYKSAYTPEDGLKEKRGGVVLLR